MTVSATRDFSAMQFPAGQRSAVAPVRTWLLIIAAAIFAMIVVGGATRLTDSGLSITEWQPILGAIPPLTHADWMEAFEKYRQIPEYQLVNKGMSLEAFKAIYWWEWAHRFLGRWVGVLFLAPFLYFWVRGYFGAGVARRLGVLFILGGAQGVLGWYMVKSGLVDRVDVSQYRLAAHLGLAFLLFGVTLLFALRLRQAEGRVVFQKTRAGAMSGWMRGAMLIVALIYVQVFLGAFVAGLDAGQGYNTWPLMDGRFIPGGLGVMSPWYANVFENALTVQFNHRMVAYLLAAVTLAYTLLLWRSGASRNLKAGALAVLIAITAQAALGIWTLLEAVPIGLGVAHQGGAALVLAAALYHYQQYYAEAEAEAASVPIPKFA